ncbi:MAG: DNA repair protein RecN, partial [Betaproteobacteria bacterium]|nr:DNA repair protein RecN [Betaproteobacteria bacterium]
VSRQELELHAGFTALTGETGAGKSILVDALSLLLGERSSAEVVRPGANAAEVSAEFEPSAAARAWLAQADFAAEELLLRRTVDAQGKSRCYINGSPATVAQLRELGELLVDIFGQHAHQSLLRAEGARSFLDAFAHVDTRACEAAYAQWRKAHDELTRATALQGSLEQERERLEFDLKELERLAPGEHEWDELSATHQRLSHSAELIGLVQRALDTLGDDDSAVGTQLAALTQTLRHAAELDATLADPLAAVENAEAVLADAVHTLRAYQGRLDADPAALDDVDQRMGLWMSLARRHRTPPRDLPGLLAAKRAQRAALDAQQDLAALQAHSDRCHTLYQQAARQLTEQRKRAAPKLAQQVTKSLQELGMPGARLEIALEPLAAPSPSGMERVEFLVSGHEGATPRPVGRVASGGELSRIALAIAVACSRKAAVPTLIFDEIDAGIGGVTAQTVGRMLRALSADTQVLCVTHLAQVAASAHQQFRVAKQAQGGQTLSTVDLLDDAQRVDEIARMLGTTTRDDKAGKSALTLARQMLRATAGD